MNVHSLVSLYDSVLVPILSEWIIAEDLCYLDGALTCQTLRSNFLRVLRLTVISVDACTYCKAESWILLRELRLKTYFYGIGLNIADSRHGYKTDAISVLSIACAKLVLFLQQVIVVPNIVKLVIRRFDSPEILNSFEYRMKIVDFHKMVSVNWESLAKACPNLTSARLYRADAKTFIAHCHQLETLYHVYLSDPDSCCCDLQRTSVLDESAVCLAEGKTFNLTGLYLKDVSEKDSALFTPLVKNVKRLQFSKYSSLVEAIVAAKCNLMYLSFVHDSLLHTHGIILIQSSPDLRELRLKNESHILRDCGDILKVVSECCPRLEKCVLIDEIVTGYTLVNLFEQTNLNEIVGCRMFQFVKGRRLKRYWCETSNVVYL